MSATESTARPVFVVAGAETGTEVLTDSGVCTATVRVQSDGAAPAVKTLAAAQPEALFVFLAGE